MYPACSAGLVRPLLDDATMMGEAEHSEEEDGPAARLRAAAESMPALVQQAKRADERLVAYVRARPLVALGAALGLGYILGRVFSRMSR
jgi:ElaB/YqjD/DUF883 family membrane-anchored ribosome-binding protein